MVDHRIENETKAMKIADYLRADILNGVFEAGSRLTTKEICDRYGVSNVPVREALRTLESEKLLEINAYKGATVLQIDEEYISNIYEIMRTLQLLIYEKALPFLTEEKLRYIREVNEAIGNLCDSREDRLRYMELDRIFHDNIISLSSNKPAVEMYDTYYRMIAAIRKAAYTPEVTRMRAAYEEHKALVEALEKKDVLLLKLAVDRHGIGAEANFFSQHKFSLMGKRSE